MNAERDRGAASERVVDWDVCGLDVENLRKAGDGSDVQAPHCTTALAAMNSIITSPQRRQHLFLMCVRTITDKFYFKKKGST